MPRTLADAAALAADPAARAGDLHRLVGIVFDRPGGADLPVAAQSEYDAAILQVVRDEEGLTDLPIVTKVDIGHTDPMWTVPQGARRRSDPTASALTFLEPAIG